MTRVVCAPEEWTGHSIMLCTVGSPLLCCGTPETGAGDTLVFGWIYQMIVSHTSEAFGRQGCESTAVDQSWLAL